jgi:hypothetical protein
MPEAQTLWILLAVSGSDCLIIDTENVTTDPAVVTFARLESLAVGPPIVNLEVPETLINLTVFSPAK